MEDFRHISQLGDVQLDRWRETGESHATADQAPAFRLPIRRLLLSATVILLGLAAWWGY